MYVCGGKVNGNGNYLCLLSLEDPENPVFLTEYNTHGYVHDIYVIDNIGYLNAGNNGLHIVDFIDVYNPETLGSLTEYPYQGYNHSGWLTDDTNTYVFADENHGYKMKICDVSNPNEINVITTILSDVDDQSMAHNLIIKDDLLYVSHYHDGLWIWDISDPENPTYVASYDTYTPSGHDNYKGAWGVYPLLPSGNILVSDMQYGLFVFAPPQNTINIDEKNNQSVIFPNPCSDILHISNNNADLKKIKLYDIYGNLILKESYSSNYTTIETNFLTAGIYLLSIENSKTESKHTIVKY